ncbi:MAG: histidine--tRNA ligase, partial [Firmicutes bacterium]|nr:histidine--tRNA ligase [Bacillota bacterium]
MRYTTPKGTKDIFGYEMELWHKAEREIRKLTREFGFTELRTPVFEDTALFLRGVGETTDIVQKEM